MSSSMSSSTGRGPWNGDGWRCQSPIPYRRDSFNYEPAVNCHCGTKAALRSGGCGFMGWFDGPVDPFVATLLVDLRDAVWALKRERVKLKSTIADVVVKMEQQKKEITALKEANEALNAGNLARSQKAMMNKLWLVGLVVGFAGAAAFMLLD